MYSVQVPELPFELHEFTPKYGSHQDLSIFVDESGNTGALPYNSRYYMICLIFHEQRYDLTTEIEEIDRKFREYETIDCFHTAPLIHSEGNFSEYSLSQRQKIMRTFYTFFRSNKLMHKEFYVDKKNLNVNNIYTRLEMALRSFLIENLDYFLEFTNIKIYYDDGQAIVKELLVNVFNDIFQNIIFRKVKPKDYRLFQTADLVCSLKWLDIKSQTKSLSKTESLFFGGKRNIIKKYIKSLNEKEFRQN